MSTKAIHELILLTRPWREEAAKRALEEVEAIERAAKSIVEGSGADALRRDDYEESVRVLESIAKDAP